MNWQDHIISDPNVLLGKPIIKGTRLSVDFILQLLAGGWSEQQVLKNYPTLTEDAMRALFAFTAECIKEENLLYIPSPHNSNSSQPRT